MKTPLGMVLGKLAALAALALSVGGCEGSVSGAATPGGPGPAGTAGNGAGGASTQACVAAAPGAMFLRRLTNQEYGATVRDLLGIDADTKALPPDLTLYGFDNNAETISLSSAHLEAYRGLAEGLAQKLVADSARRATLLGCDPAGAERAACLSSFAKSFGLKAWRRPLRDEEVTDLVTRASAAPPVSDPWSAPQYIIEAFFQSSSFLFRVEVGEPDAAKPKMARLTGHEVATRLSYLLWGTGPHAELQAAAASGTLASADGVEKLALAMLDDNTRAQPTIWSFTQQWLRIGSLAAVERPTADYPLFTEAMRTSMAEETRRLIESQSQTGKPLLDLLDTPTTFVDATLAPLYGVAAPASGWAQVMLPAEQGRRGLLTSASVLTLTGSVHSTTPILRGKYVRQVLLCDDLPPPPPEVPTLPEATAGLGERERLAQHRADPSCAGCHELLEPLGFGLSHFDAIGKYRTADADGKPVDTSGVIEGLTDAAFNGSAELATRLRSEPKVARCLSTHLVRFALGRKESASETCTIDQLGGVLQGGGDYRSLVRALVRSDAFRYRPVADAVGVTP